MKNANLVVRHKVFKGTFTTWEAILTKASAYATRIGAERLINIGHSDDSGRAVIVVWYWGEPE